ncbi:MAG: 50S ribosomal protein P1 [Candidatus Aenigmarchaeota archaeon]|nr:50S ribosomal protein P1 [Candidatus Aenigmarchaeota archaeon]
MNLIYAALLLHSAGKEINEENLKKVVDATGEKVDDTQIKALVAALEGVNIDEAISKAAMPVAVAPAAGGEEKATEEKKDEKKEENVEKKAEEAAAGLGALFG